LARFKIKSAWVIWQQEKELQDEINEFVAVAMDGRRPARLSEAF